MAAHEDREDYEAALSAEQRIFEDCLDVHDLPGIFHYWSQTHLQPRALCCGFPDSTALFADRLGQRFTGDPRPRRFCSLGSGNSDLEIELAGRLRAAGRREFTIDCVDLNTTMRDRAVEAAAQAGVAEHLRFIAADLNHWHPADEYDAVIANQSLHHILNLEGLFDDIKKTLRPDGAFLISDMIGRNGHLRWPEAMAIIQEYWKALPPSYRVNRRLGRYEHEFQDWDCSTEGFEGVRAQDILPLLVDRFEFHLFFPFGNLIDPFIDRTFGPNFDPSQPSDREFIDRVQYRDAYELAAGNLKPTHLIAVAGTAPVASPVFADGLTPRFCVRTTGLSFLKPAAAAAGTEGQTSCGSFLSTPERAAAEAGKLALMLRDLTVESETWKNATLRTEKNFEERTDWALSLDSELKAARILVEKLQNDLEQRTAWALGIQESLESEIKTQARCAQSLEKELEEQIKPIATPERQLGYLKRPWTAVAPLCRKIIEAAVSAAHRKRNEKTPGSTRATGE